MTAALKIREITGCNRDLLPDEVLSSDEPVVLKGLVSDWPLVQSARQSSDTVDRYLRRFSSNVPLTVSVGPPEIEGRIFYNEDMTALNFEARRIPLNELLDTLRELRHNDKPPVYYVGSTAVDYCLPGLRDENDLAFGDDKPLVSIWIGNQTRIAAHYDIPDNIACVVAGRRRFTLFPPDQLENLYVGPLDFTPAGQAISLVDFHQPHFEKHPKFREALKHARVATLEAGDAVYVPGLWWHHVEGLDSFNMLVNYWWRRTPAYMGTPLDVLHHALLSIRDLPEPQRQVWQGIFDHYVFGPDEDVVAHIPSHRRGVLAPIDDLSARKLRALLLKRLNR